MSETITEAELERRAQAIFKRRKSRTDEQQLAGARFLAARELKAEEQARNRQDPAWCRAEAERRGLQLVAETWKAPCHPGLAFRPNPKFIIDDKGVHVVTVDQSAAFVCSPAAEVAPGRWAVKRTASWETVTLGRGSARNALDTLRAAGLRIGSGNVVLEHPTTDTDNSVPIANIALEWLLRRGPGDEIVCVPDATFLLWDDPNPNAGAVGGFGSPLSPR